MINSLLSGWLTLIFFLLGISYSLLKRISFANGRKINKKLLLDFHCISLLIASVLGIIHLISGFITVRFSPGYICLSSMILISVTGLFLKYSRSISVKSRKFIIASHIILTIVFIMTLIIHVISYFAML